jgi:benzoylformate decarboxylase
VRGRDALLQLLVQEQVRYIFGNPGTTELPLMDELATSDEIQYVLALQENTAVGMADGYAQATGRPSFVNLHTSSGLGGGMGNITNAWANRTPIVLTAGQQDRRHLLSDPMLSGDLCGMPRTVTKWQHEVRNAGEVGTVLRRAFKDASSPPRGPVFVSIPMDVLDEDGAEVPARSHICRDSVPTELPECARLLAELPPGEVAIVAGEEMAGSETFTSAINLAQALGCVVYGTPLYSVLPFASDHPLWRGAIGPSAAATHETLKDYRRVLYLGGQVGYVYPHSDGPTFPEKVELLHLSADNALIGRSHPVRLGLVADVPSTVEALLPLVSSIVDRKAAEEAFKERISESNLQRAEIERKALDRYSYRPVHPMAAVHALISALPPNGVVVDEAITASNYVRGFHRSHVPGTYYFCRGGGLGWGMPAALGVKLAKPDAPVLCIVGDGATMYAIQALYTAARYNIGVVFAVLNNRQYRILREALATLSESKSRESGRFVAMDLDTPPIKYCSLADGLGVGSTIVESPTEVADAVRAAFESASPYLIEIPIQGMTDV